MEYVENVLNKDIYKLLKTMKKKKSSKNYEKFYKEMIRAQKRNNKVIKPKIDYDKKYDIFYMWFGGNTDVKYTIETSPDIRFDINKNENIVAVEIENFSEHLKEEKRKRKHETRKVK